jgi:hypothetical protein
MGKGGQQISNKEQEQATLVSNPTFFGSPTKMFNRICGYATGIGLTLNFLVFWGLPISGMGMSWKHVLQYPLLPLYNWLDNNALLRSFAETCIYKDKKSVDYFLMSSLLLWSSALSLGTMFYWQKTNGYLEWWQIAFYYCMWVGVGGRMMGAAYTLAHREGHTHGQGLYKSWINKPIGNFFENWLGCFFGNVPYNFTTSHVYIHHRLDGGLGDTFYCWDMDRTNWLDFMLYVQRIFLHMIGYSSLKWFRCNGVKQAKWYSMLKKGVFIYVMVAASIFALTRSLSFLFWIYVQPLFCMTYFLALINVGFHGFIEYNSEGVSVPEVNSTTIIDGDDDYWGEDDHMAHHYAGHVYHRDLPEYQEKRRELYTQRKASVFKGLSIAELSVYLIFGMMDKLVDHYVDYSGKMTKEEIKSMLILRATRREMSYEDYNDYLSNPTEEARDALRPTLIAGASKKTK